jgi:NADH-quinone oxidoreductase subunit H
MALFDAVEVTDQALDWVFGLVGFDSPAWLAQLLVWLIGSVLLFSVVLTTGGLFTLVFRRMFAFVTQRIGPNRVGPFGLFQLVADGLKLITKEDIIPAKADRKLFRMAPYLAVAPFVLAFAPIPWSETIIFSNVGVGILFILGISAISPLAEITAGWASNNKYSIYGGVRAAALDFSYEIPMVLAAVGVIMLAGSANTQDIVEAQRGVWFFLPQFLGLFIFFAAALAKAGLVPTDLPEAESELVAGYSTEYSGMRFGLFYVVLFASILFIGALVTTLYLGGWLSPFGDLTGYEVDLLFVQFALPTAVAFVLGDGIVWFLLKTIFVCFVIFWLWLTLPRVRVDQYLNLAWKVMFPLALVNLVIAAFVRWYFLA